MIEPLTRRIVLLSKDGSVERVLVKLSAMELQGAIRGIAKIHPGRVVAGEWLGSRGWVRFLLAGFPLDPEYFSKEDGDEG